MGDQYQNIRLAFKEKATVLENEIGRLKQELSTATRKNEELRTNVAEVNAQWADRLAQETTKAEEADARYNQLVAEYNEAIDLNIQLTKGLTEYRNTVRAEVQARADLEQSKTQLLHNFDCVMRERDSIASNYQSLYESLKEKDSVISLLKEELHSTTTSLQNANDTKIKVEERCTSLAVDLKHAGGEIESKNKEIRTLSEQQQRLEAKVQALESELGSQCSLTNASGVQSQTLKMQLDELSIAHRAAELKVVSLEDSLQKQQVFYTQKLEEALAENKEQGEKLIMQTEVVAQLTRQVDAMEDSADQIVKQRIGLETVLGETEAELKTLKSQLNAKMIDCASLEERALFSEKRIVEIELRNKELMETITCAQTASDDHVNIITSLRAELERLSGDMSQAGAEVADYRGRLEVAESTNNLLRSQNEALKIQMTDLETKASESSSNLSATQQELSLTSEKANQLSTSLKLCKETLAANIEEFNTGMTRKQTEIETLQTRLKHYESELGAAVKEIHAARDLVEAHKDEASRLLRNEEISHTKIKSQEANLDKLSSTMSTLKKELDASKRNLDSAVQHISELESSAAKRDEERKVLQIEILQLKNRLKQEQQEVRNVTEMHQSMRDAFERRAQQNQEVVNASDSRAAALETELSEVISKYNTLAQTHKELKIKSQQLSTQLEEAQKSKETGQAESEVVVKQRRLMYELNLRLAEQETVVRDLTAANQSLHKALTQAASQPAPLLPATQSDVKRSAFTVQPLNTMEGPIRHPKKLRIEPVAPPSNSQPTFATSLR